jgi:hypothetical protein
LKQHTDGDRQFVKVLGAVLDHGLDAVEAACTEALAAGIASGDVILTVLARATTAAGASQHHHARCIAPEDRTRGLSAATTVQERSPDGTS